MLKFLVIDDGWQSINFDGDNPFEECKKFRKYKEGSLFRLESFPYDKSRTKKILLKAKELEIARKARCRAIQAGLRDLSGLDIKIEELKKEIDQMLTKKNSFHIPMVARAAVD
ncbi:hypothetical protein Cni_G14172 [Canna indica]|uniref:Uncharacterized protein n=1 Tax=Canna indica TaxID=4628 RepID=A0AAQ3QDQ4_9LILI|nr:hypothetical protein Cni_G14172 [Canna indica]